MAFNLRIGAGDSGPRPHTCPMSKTSMKNIKHVKFSLYLPNGKFVGYFVRESRTVTEPIAHEHEKLVKRNMKLKYQNPYAWHGATGREHELEN